MSSPWRSSSCRKARCHNANALYPDVCYFIVEQGDRPTTYRAVVSWSDRDIDREGGFNPRIHMGTGRH